MCAECENFIVAIDARCWECKTRVPDAPSAPRAHFLPTLKTNKVVQISLGINAESLNKTLAIEEKDKSEPIVSARVERKSEPLVIVDQEEPTTSNSGPVTETLYEVERILDKGRKNMKIEYLVSWKGYPGEDTWQPVATLGNCTQAIYELSVLPKAGVNQVHEDDSQQIKQLH
jgi:hypothetical protein